jgi:3',5'-cyclic AMP phosphodiesterase CpdA
MHLQPERGAREAVVQCFEHVYNLPDPPDLIFNGGDLIMDSMAAGEARVSAIWDLWREISTEYCRIPFAHVLGNHDVWGWHRRSGCTGNEPLFGKKWALRELNMPGRYYSFERGGWKFIVLDSISMHMPGLYQARLDDQQLDWLKNELESTPADVQIAVISHVSIIAGGAVLFTGNVGELERTGNWVIPGGWLHIDARVLHNLLLDHPNVRLCISGHNHNAEWQLYDGIHYITTGSVSGQWWHGMQHHTPPGYGLFDLYSDGSFDWEYVAY